MRFIHENRLYDTETAELVHETGFDSTDPRNAGHYSQSLYRTERGKFFYVNCFPSGEPNYGVMDKYGLYSCNMKSLTGQEVDDVDKVIEWLERHDGAEVILERWPEKVWAG